MTGRAQALAALTADCPWCEHARLHGWWGPDIPAGHTHHPCCHQTMSGRIWHCPGGTWGGCCRSFSRDSHADKHRVDGHCKDPATLRTKPRDGTKPRPVLVLRDDGVWASPPPDQPLPFWKGASA